MAPYFLHYHNLLEGQKSDYNFYDFWGIKLGNANSDWSGFTDFKLKFGGQKKSYIGAYDLVLMPELYKTYIDQYEKSN